MSNEITAVFDLDMIIYRSAFAGEKRTIEATYIPTGKVYTFKTRTEMYGHWKKKEGGWLAEENAKRIEKGKEPLLVEDFEIVDVQSAEPIENVLHTVKSMIHKSMKEVKASSMIGFIEGKETPLKRLERSTILKYKGGREDSLSPIYKKEVTDYLQNKYNTRLVNDGHETDDWVIMESYKKPSHVVISFDKDTLGCPVKMFNPLQPDKGIVDGNCFGEVWWDEGKSKFDGFGRKFFYLQWVYGDDVDNYRANAASDKEWGMKSAFHALEHCRNDVECFEAVRDVYKMLYPEPVKVVGWREDEIEVDWLYMANEVWDLARMLRFPNDVVTAEQVLKKYRLI